MIKIILIDDHKIVRNGIKMILETAEEIEIIGEYDSFVLYEETSYSKVPDIFIIDISMPEINGIEAAKRIKQNLPDVRIIILSMHTNEEFVIQSIKAGADAYIPKNISKKELLEAVEKVYQGEEYFSNDISKIIIRSMMQQTNSAVTSKIDLLSKREIELLKLFAQGKSNKEIADELFISNRTVESHKNHILVKLEFKNQVELVKFAIKEGLIEL